MYSITRLQVQVVSVFSHQDLFGPAQNWMFSARRLCPHPEYKNYRKLGFFVFCRINKKQNFNYFVCVPLMQPDLLKYEKNVILANYFSRGESTMQRMKNKIFLLLSSQGLAHSRAQGKTFTQTLPHTFNSQH